MIAWIFLFLSDSYLYFLGLEKLLEDNTSNILNLLTLVETS